MEVDSHSHDCFPVSRTAEAAAKREAAAVWVAPSCWAIVNSWVFSNKSTAKNLSPESLHKIQLAINSH